MWRIFKDNKTMCRIGYGHIGECPEERQLEVRGKREDPNGNRIPKDHKNLGFGGLLVHVLQRLLAGKASFESPARYHQRCHSGAQKTSFGKPWFVQRLQEVHSISGHAPPSHRRRTTLDQRRNPRTSRHFHVRSNCYNILQQFPLGVRLRLISGSWYYGNSYWWTAAFAVQIPGGAG